MFNINVLVFQVGVLQLARQALTMSKVCVYA